MSIESKQKRAKIWAIGGGKGGAGKTAVSSSIAVALAHSGFRCIAVDADFGAANLHTLLGALTPRLSIRDFLAGDVATLDEVACPTPIENLRIISGSRQRIDAANLDHPRRQKLLRHLAKLDADHVVIDLGAGSSFNALDFFVAADLPLAVVTPEPTAIENTFHFIRASWFRAMRPAAQRAEVREAIRMVLGAPGAREQLKPGLLIDAVREVDPVAGAALRAKADAYRPALLVNRAASPADRALGRHIAESCEEGFGAHVRAVGSLPFDRAVAQAVQRREAILETAPRSEFAEDVYVVTERMLRPDLEVRHDSAPTGTALLRKVLFGSSVDYEKRNQVRSIAELSYAA